MNNSTIEDRLEESLRDAQVAYYLRLEGHIKSGIDTVEKLYDHCLLDGLVNHDVPATPVSFAISSLQHHIDLILTNRSTGFQFSEEQHSLWHDHLSQYSTWAARQKLMHFPSLYLDPALRMDKTENFRQLENDLTQNRIDSRAAQNAILGYLVRFEEVANLKVLNGYIHGNDIANGVYYFLARSRSADAYYWRSLDMSQRPVRFDAKGSPSLADRPDPQAWSQWEKADVPISQNAIEHTIRPVWFNNRLFIFWAEIAHQDPRQLAEKSSRVTSNSQLKLSYAWRKIDGSWSLPGNCLEAFGEGNTWQASTPDQLHDKVEVLAMADGNRIRVVMRLDEHNLSVAYIDNNMAVTLASPSGDSEAEKKMNISSIEGIKRSQLLSSGTPDNNPLIETVGHRQYIVVGKSHEIELNTLFAAEMIRRAENSLDELFNLDSPKAEILAQDATNPAYTALDFHGAYGEYFTELFLYVPWLVASRLNSEHRYEDALKWVHYLFEPWGRDANGQQQFWKSEPLNPVEEPSYAHNSPHDPHQIALSHRQHFRKAVFFLYIDILLNRADAAYRQLTADSLNQAKSLYLQARHLLGQRPEVNTARSQWKDISLAQLSTDGYEPLKRLEQQMASLNLFSIPLYKQENAAESLSLANDNLRLPLPPDMLKRWDQVESRLYNLRHYLDIAGKPLQIALFDAPQDPRALLLSSTTEAGRNTRSSLAALQIPHYRFNVMHGLALNAVDSLIQFGSTLLSLVERQEQSQFQEVQQQQAWTLAALSVDLQMQALRADQQNHKALQAGRAIVQQRLKHFEALLKHDINAAETTAGQLYLSSGASEGLAAASQAVAGGLMLAPNTFGLANGGMRWEGAMHALSAIAQAKGAADRTTANHLDRTAQFARRREEWTLAHEQAALELTQVDAQLMFMEEQRKATELLVRQAQQTLSQARRDHEFLSRRFTQAQLYLWLGTQLSPLYSQAYDTTLALCQAAEAAWQYEIADFTTRFLQRGSWQSNQRGLGAGEELKLALMKMQANYLQRNARELEIRKNVSLRQLKSQSGEAWSTAQDALKNDGYYDFAISHTMFNSDYPTHYLRRIKTISVSFPAVLGPYENVRAMLMQTSSEVALSPTDASQVKKDLRVREVIALSTGMDDNGLFTLNFNDERYLPFEFTGAVSTWRLALANHDKQTAFIDSLTDIIVQIHYTARSVGGLE